MRRRRNARLAWTALLAVCAPGCYVATVGGLVADDAGSDAAPDTLRADVLCGATQTLCGGTCVDTQSDPRNCGMCSVACASGSSCISGACALDGMDAGDDDVGTCTMALLPCGMSCVDPQSDPTNCGACGNACTSGMMCSGGGCVMTPPDAGMDVEMDSAIVRTCHADIDCVMFPGGNHCISGACGCLPGETACSGICVTLTTDPRNCGTCGTSCTSGACAMSVCH